MALARPMPDAAPVTTITLSSSPRMSPLPRSNRRTGCRPLYKMIKVVHMSTTAAELATPSVPAPGATTSERILDAAEQCMARHGIRRVSMADVAARAGLSRGALYLHFADRADLVDAVLTRSATRFVASSEEAVGRRRTLATQVAEAAVFIVEHLGDARLTLRLPGADDTLLAAVLSARIDRLGGEWVAFWLPRLADAERRGEIRTNLDHRQAAEWIVRQLLSFALVPPITFPAGDPAELRSFVGAHVVSGLAA
jgi:AcrR family transcriptional regulator